MTAKMGLLSKAVIGSAFLQVAVAATSTYTYRYSSYTYTYTSYRYTNTSKSSASAISSALSITTIGGIVAAVVSTLVILGIWICICLKRRNRIAHAAPVIDPNNYITTYPTQPVTYTPPVNNYTGYPQISQAQNVPPSTPASYPSSPPSTYYGSEPQYGYDENKFNSYYSNPGQSSNPYLAQPPDGAGAPFPPPQIPAPVEHTNRQSIGAVDRPGSSGGGVHRSMSVVSSAPSTSIGPSSSASQAKNAEMEAELARLRSENQQLRTSTVIASPPPGAAAPSRPAAGEQPPPAYDFV
jgi:hypothetical protein